MVLSWREGGLLSLDGEEDVANEAKCLLGEMRNLELVSRNKAKDLW